MARSGRDRKEASRVLGVLFVALPFVLVQGVYGSLLDDEVKLRACDVDHSGEYFTGPLLVAIGAVLLATVLALPRPRWAAGFLAVGAIASLVFAARGGWGAAGCAFGV